jgi:hypothetical protein
MTMLIKLLWRNFKQMVLYQYNCPHIDFATYALVTHGIAPYWLCFNQIVKNPRDGCSRSLYGEQLLIKCTWLALCKCPIKGSYDSNVEYWLCSCGAQKYHLYLLCKHLVQVLPLPDSNWWANVVWWHTVPFYDIHSLLPENEQETAPIPTVLGPHHWTRQDSVTLQNSLPLTVLQSLVSGTHGLSALNE